METLTLALVERDYVRTLKAFRIQPLLAAQLILKIITERFSCGFTLYELFVIAEKEKLNISSATIIATVGMFRIRKLVTPIHSAELSRIGPQQVKFICTLNVPVH